MPACPQCHATIRFLAILPDRSAIRERAFTRWRETECAQCAANLEVVPWTKYAAIGICLLLCLAPDFLLAHRFIRIVPDTLPSFLARIGEGVWYGLVFFLLLPRLVRLRVRETPAPRVASN